MKNPFASFAAAMLVSALTFAPTGSAQAEKIAVKFTKNARSMHAESKADASGREIARYFYLDTINASQGLDLVEERGHNRDDQVDGTGTHSGIAADVTRDGHEIFQTFAGSHKTITKADGSWELTYQGVSIINGGTGKYKNAKGRINYTGRVTADSFHEADEGQIEY